jgi:hypothetical protein
MGWRYQDYLDRQQEKADREWLAGLSPRDRLRFRLWQAWRLSILIAVLLLVFSCMYAARSAPIEPGRIEVIDGDTIKVGTTVYRLVGFDTPEAGANARCELERTLAANATWRLLRLPAWDGRHATLQLRPPVRRAASTRPRGGRDLDRRGPRSTVHLWCAILSSPRELVQLDQSATFATRFICRDAPTVSI